MTAQIERALQTEIAYRLKAYPVVSVPVPNGIFLPSRSPAEQAVVARIVNRMKTDGMLLPGSPDLCILGAKGGLYCELKREKSRDLFTTRPKGRLSPEQKDFRDRCAAAGVKYLVASSWSEIEPELEGLY